MEKRPAGITGMNSALIAPCGMNCRLCMAYGRERKPCPGCRGEDTNKAKTCAGCKIKNCEHLAHSHARYCYSCEDYPCEKIRHIDKRYRAKYGMSMIENLTSIRNLGVRQFIKNEEEKWQCPHCGELICVHKPQCLNCGYLWH